MFKLVNSFHLSLVLAIALLTACSQTTNTGGVSKQQEIVAQVGLRPLYLVEKLPTGRLKTELEQCRDNQFYRHDFSIGHRGAPLQFPEHTRESYQAAIDSGAGVLECDVIFTKDQELVCRHSQCDLAETTNILEIPELAAKCRQPFKPADPALGRQAIAQCCTSDITLAEFQQLKGKMDGVNRQATTVAEYLKGTPNWRTDLYAATGTLMTHRDSIEMFKAARVKMTPELKAPMVDMPFNGFSQQDYADKMIDEYRQQGVTPSRVYPQSFNLKDIKYWLAKHPSYGAQAVYLDDRYENNQTGVAVFDHMNPQTWSPSMTELAEQGVTILAPPLWVLLTTNDHGQIVPSAYALAAKAAGLELITWTLERSGQLSQQQGGWYYQSIHQAINGEGDTYQVLDVLARQVGVSAIFSDWPATVTYYANCVNLPAK